MGVFVLLVGRTIQAEERYWVGGAQGNWSDKAWARSEVGEGDIWDALGNDAVFAGAVSQSITFSSSVKAGKIRAEVDTEINAAFDAVARERAYKYFRFCIDDIKGFTGCMQLSEIVLFDEKGVQISSENFSIYYDVNSYGLDKAYPSGEAPENAVDGDVGTKWLDFRAGTEKSFDVRKAAWLQFEMKEPQKLSCYKWYTANDEQARDPASWRLLASEDGTNWKILDVVTGFNVTSDRKKLAFQKFLLPFSKYRFKVDKSGTGDETAAAMQISDVALYGADGRRFVHDTDFTLSSSEGAPTGKEGVQKAVDTNNDGTGNTSSKWYDNRLGSNNDNVWIGFDLKVPEFVSKYEWYMGNDTENYQSRNPSEWKLTASYDGEHWHELDVVTQISITAKNYGLAYKKEFGSDLLGIGEIAVLSVEELNVADGRTLAVSGNSKLTALGNLCKEGSGTLVLGGENGVSAKPRKGFFVSEGVLQATNATFRLGVSETANYDAPFVVGYSGGGEATAVLNGGSIYCVSLGSGKYNAMQIGADTGDIGYLYATNVNVVSRGRIRIGTGANSVAIVEKTGGDWKVQESAYYGRFLMGEGANSRSEFYHRSGTLETWSYICLGLADNAYTYFELSGGTVTQAHNNDVRIGDGGNSQSRNEFCVKGGTLNVKTNIRLANGAPGMLTVHGGLVNVSGGQVLVSCSGDEGDVGQAALNGGILRTKRVVHGNGTEDGFFRFNGGTLEAVESGTLLDGGRLKVSVGENGGIIDNAGHAVSIAADIAGEGEIALVGAGTTEIVQSQTGSDVTFRIAEGVCTLGDGVSLKSSVVVAKGARFTASKSVLTENPFISSLVLEDGAVLGIVAGVKPVAVGSVTMPESGKVKITNSSGTAFGMGIYELFASDKIPDGVEDKFEPLLADGLVCSFSRENGVLRMTVSGGNEAVWTGAAADNDLSNKENWFLEMMPNGRPALINLPSPATLVCSSSIYPTSVVFPEESVAATIEAVNGAVITVSDSVINRSSSVQRFTAPVRFEGDVKLEFSGDTLVFDGGVTGDGLVLSGMENEGWHLKGIFNLNRWEIGKYCYIDGGTVVNAKSATGLGDVRIEEGGSLVVGTYTINASEETHNKWIIYRNRGIFNVTDKLVNSSSVTVAMFSIDDSHEVKGTNIIAHLINTPTADSKFLFGRYTDIGTGFNKWNRSNFVLGDVTWGEHALAIEGYRQVQCKFKFAKSGRIAAGTEGRYFGFLEETEFDISDRGDVPTDVVFDCDIKNVTHTSNYYGGFSVLGGGKLTLASGRTIKMHTKSVNVSGTGTVLALEPGASISAGKIYVGVSSMFKVAGSGEVFLDANLELKDAACLAFNFTQRTIDPVLKVPDVTFGEGRSINVAVSSARRPLAGRHVLTSSNGKFADVVVSAAPNGPDWIKNIAVENGELVLTVKPQGTSIRVR